MCILFTHVDPDPAVGGYRMVVASNRDESFKRPSMPAHRDEMTNVIGGKDMEPTREGGMWLGFNTKGEQGISKYCFSAILNMPSDLSKDSSPRGTIVRDYLIGIESLPEYINKIERDNSYNGYALVGIELSKEGAHTFYHSNSPKVDSVYSGKQTLSFGNSPIFNPLTKVLAGRRTFQNILNQDIKGDELVDALLEMLKDKTRNLPDPVLQGRFPQSHESLSSICVDVSPSPYGTRTHSVILVDYDWNLHFIEHTMKEPINVEDPEWVVTKLCYKL